MNPKKPKILFVAQPEAIHTARWISQLNHGDFDLHLFQSRQSHPIKEMPQLTVHSLLPQSFTQFNSVVKNKACIPWRLKRGSDRLRKWFLLKYRGANEQTATLAHVINTLKPDIVHTMEMQLAGYQMLSALPYIQNRKSFTWIYSCWGNDIAFYRNDPNHLDLIGQVLKNVDYYTADCARDMRLIAELGPTGKPLSVFPTGGGYEIEELRKLRSQDKPSMRKVIAVKGYHDEKWTGRALYALRALEECREQLEDYEIIVYRPPSTVRGAVQYLKQFRGLNIRCLADWEDNIEILKLFGRSRISLATNLSDGTPNSVLESMIMGAFPIQSNTADLDGWIRDGVNGSLVKYDDVSNISAAIRNALRDNNLVDNADVESESIVQSKLNRNVIAKQVNHIYRNLLETTQPN